MAPFRPRRLVFLLVSLPFLFVFLLYIGSTSSRRGLTRFLSTSNPDGVGLPDEIFGLLHFVSSPDEAGRVLWAPEDPEGAVGETDSRAEKGLNPGGPVDPKKPIDMAWYAWGSISQTRGAGRGRAPNVRGGWEERMRVLREEYPLIVFSKSYCPFSKRAKKVLETYDLTPRPKIIEVDLRADTAHLKSLLTRLTQRSTFPNIILHGRSLGGSDELVRLHEDGLLGALFEKGGLRVGWDGEGGEGVVV
ncbi:thioredoxin-like protein [Phlebopus sp. FC_14]|nr:thioredoxin-like protein [Phlebopus sp. FC_14]